MQTFLFDMDGTLTYPRKKIQKEMITFLTELSTCGDIGVVTGSPIEYIKDQLGPLFNESKPNILRKVTLYPCNGTQVYSYRPETGEFEQTYKVSIKDHLSNHGDPDVLYYHLVMNLLDLQTYALKKFKDIKPTGHFVSFRESLINWCMIGREADHPSRKSFVDIDSDLNIRDHLKELLDSRLSAFGLGSLTTALGGSTSIDIYPNQWDKTYVLNHVDADCAWFFGDKCKPRGNDYAIFKKLSKTNRSFEVICPDDTLLKAGSVLERLKSDDA